MDPYSNSFGQVPTTRPTQQQPQQTDPLLTIDPMIGMAPIQAMALSLIKGGDPMAGLEDFGRMQGNALQREGYKANMDISNHNLELAKKQDQRAEQTHQSNMEQKEYEKTVLRPFDEAAMAMEIVKGRLTLEMTQAQLSAAVQKASASGIDVGDIRAMQGDAYEQARKILSEQYDADYNLIPPKPEQIAAYANKILEHRLSMLTGSPPPESEDTFGGTWESFTPEQQAFNIRAAKETAEGKEILRRQFPQIFRQVFGPEGK